MGGSLAGKNYEDTSQALPWYLLWNGGGDGKITFFLRDTASASFRAGSTSDINDDNWHFIAGRADAETGKATLWVDGVQESEVDFNIDDGYGTGEGVFHIGRHYDRYTTGIIDEVILFNIALDEADMKSIMDDGITSVTAVEPLNKLTTTWGRNQTAIDRGKTMKQILTPLALVLLLFIGFGCATENPVEEMVDTGSVETDTTGTLHGDVQSIEGVLIQVRLLKDGQLVAQVETQASYEIDAIEAGNYTLQISAKGYETKEVAVTVIAEQVVSVDKVVLVALETPVSHLHGVLTNETTGEVLGGVSLQLTDNAGKVYETLTTAAGVFTFENLPVQQPMTLRIAHAGYEDKEIIVHPIPADETLELTVELMSLPEVENLPPGQGLRIGSQAPDFELPDSNGKAHTLADYIPNKNVVLVFYRGGW